MTEYKLSPRNIPLDSTWDVVVVGGGPAGCAAATAAAREGAKTLLVEAESALGGMGTLGLVPFFIGHDDGEKIISRGLAERIWNHLRTNMPQVYHTQQTKPLWPPTIDPELLKRFYDDMVTSVGAHVLFHTRLTAVEKSSDDRIDALILASKAGLTAVRAKLYIDGTGDGDLAAWAGAPFEKGDPDGKLQPATLCYVITNVDGFLLHHGRRIHFYDPESPIYKAVKSEKYPLIFELHTCNAEIGPSTWGFNAGHVFDVDNTDPASTSRALIEGRKLAAQYRDAFTEFMPRAFGNSFLVATGALLGVRETRRIMGDYLLTADDYYARRSFPDDVCRCAYPIDIHYDRKGAVESAARSLAEHRKPDPNKFAKGESFGVPYRALIPRGLSNLLVAGRCISTDRIANGSIRIMPCCLNTGEAAGLAAALALHTDADSRNVDPAQLRRRLKDYGAYLPDPTP